VYGCLKSILFLSSDHTVTAYFTAGSSRDGEPTMPDAFLDNKHEIVDDWRHVDTVSCFRVEKDGKVSQKIPVNE